MDTEGDETPPLEARGGLPAVPIKAAYDSEEDDILNSFYIPMLANSVSYHRLVGFFSSSSLAVAARGISALVANGGHMKLVVGAKLRKADVEAIRQGHEDPMHAVEEITIRDLDSMELEFVRDHVRALGWMVANGKLEIKVAIVTDDTGLPIDKEGIEQIGIFHQKVGIFYDDKGNTVSFSGSVNETYMAWLENIEEFKVFRSWVDGEKDHLRSDCLKFEKYWSGTTKKAKVMDVPRAIREKLIQIAPDHFEDLHLGEWRRAGGKVKLRDYQSECIGKLLERGRGLVEMATATGKTYTALGFLEELHKREKRLAVIITCPFIHLVEDPWIKSLKFFGIPAVKVYGSSTTWKDHFMNGVLDFNNGHSNLLVVVTTHDTFHNSDFIDIASRIALPTLLIADEVHGLGSPERRKGLLQSYAYRIGLSATPRRWLDDEGTSVLVDYFGETVFEFTLAQAIKARFLTPYEYYPHFVELSTAELEDYLRMTRKIAAKYHAKRNERDEELLEIYSIQRQQIVVNAQNKYKKFEEVMRSLGSVSHCLVYCSPAQMDRVLQILNGLGLIYHKFTAEESAEKRKELLDGFAQGKFHVLVAMKCLDEGVDVPATRIAVIVASSGNPKQFIQRRGRLLRKFASKEKAIIHDIGVVPSLSGQLDPEFYDLERKIILRELQRYREFSGASMNPVDTLNRLFPIEQRYKV